MPFARPNLAHFKPHAENKKAIIDIEINKKLMPYKTVDDFWTDMRLSTCLKRCTKTFLTGIKNPPRNIGGLNFKIRLF